MTRSPESFQYHLPSLYLDMARAMFCEIKGPTGAIKEDPDVQRRLVPTVFVTVAVSAVFAYQALEAFCNAQLFTEWDRRSEATSRATRLKQQFSGATTFEELRREKLGEKLKKLCRILDIPTPGERDDQIWNRFKKLVEVTRHFVMHPDPERFHQQMSRIMEANESGLYVATAEAIIQHIFDESGAAVPEWVKRPTNFQGEGFVLLGVPPT